MLSSVRQFLLVFVAPHDGFMLVCLHQRDRTNHVPCQLEEPSVMNRKKGLDCCLFENVLVITMKSNILFSLSLHFFVKFPF